MSFSTEERIIALAPENVATLFALLLEQFGEELRDGQQSVRTIGGHWDDGAKTRMRAASLEHGSITGVPLTDGRVAFRCLWQSDLVAAFEAGQLGAEVTELTAEEFAELRAAEVLS